MTDEVGVSASLTQGHYRYSEALFSLGEIKRAIEANSNAQKLCKGDREGIKDLEQQQLKFLTDLDVDIKDIKGIISTHSARERVRTRYYLKRYLTNMKWQIYKLTARHRVLRCKLVD